MSSATATAGVAPMPRSLAMRVAQAAPPAPAPAPSTDDGATDDANDAALQQAIKDAEADSEKEPEKIVLVGSYFERKELETTAPVTVLDREDLDDAGLDTVGDILQNLPAQSNGINAQVNNGGDGSTRVDLRGLGTQRTLVLLNGRRVVPGGIGADDSVDLNAIPLAMIDRVEVLKDGASAIYGSDAIGGVVNIITRNDYQGAEAAAYTGASTHGDGLTYDLSLVTGAGSDKGNIVFSAGFQHQSPVMAGDRAFSRYDRDYDYSDGSVSIGGSPSIPGGRLDTHAVDTNGDGLPDAGFTLCGDSQYCTHDGNGGWRPYQDSDAFNYQPDNYLFTPSQRYNLFSAGTYHFGPQVDGFFEASYLNRTSDQQLAAEPFANATSISKDSIYNPLGVDVLGYRRRLQEFGPRRSLQNVDTFRIVTGLNGKLAPDDAEGAAATWRWELSFNYGRTQAQQENQGNLNLGRLANALGPSFRDPDGVAHCGTPGNEIVGCVPMDILGAAGSITKEMADYVTFTGISSGFNQQESMLASAHGQLAKTPWGGDLSLAVGGDYRREAGAFTPDPLTATGETTGNAIAPTAGDYNVVEGFGELSLVPVVNKGAAKWVELDGAARAFRFSTFGSGVTWKAGGLFRTVGGLAVRGTASTAFRAPSVAELYQGAADSFPSGEDPCDTAPPSAGGDVITLDPAVAQRCAAQGVAPDAQFGTSQVHEVIGGNPKLDAETGRVFTAGLVFEPPPVKGLSFTLDYFNVSIDHAIQALGTQVILANCYQRGVDADCAKIHRDPTLGNQIDFIDDPTDNVGGTSTSGVDFAVAYKQDAGRIGTFHHQLEGSYLIAYDLDNSFQVLHGKGNYDLAALFPALKANLTTTWNRKGYGAGANVHFVSGIDECEAEDCNGGAPSRKVDSNVTADVFGDLTFKNTMGETTVSVGVNNLLDQAPPIIYGALTDDSDASTYDYMGRFFYARVAQKF